MDRQHSATSLCIVVDKVIAEQLLNQCMPVHSWLAVRYPQTHFETFMPPPTGTSVAVPSIMRNSSDDTWYCGSFGMTFSQAMPPLSRWDANQEAACRLTSAMSFSRSSTRMLKYSFASFFCFSQMCMSHMSNSSN